MGFLLFVSLLIVYELIFVATGILAFVPSLENNDFLALQSTGYQPCGDVTIHSFGRPLNSNFLGQYTQQFGGHDHDQFPSRYTVDCVYLINFLRSNHDDGERGQFAMVSGAYKMWWSLFRGRMSRWSIGTVLGDDSSVIAYKDSHAMHPSEITRTRPPWRVYHIATRKWRVDNSIHIRCNDDLSVFQWTEQCMVLGVTNAFNQLDALDYLLVEGTGLNAKYSSFSNGMSIHHDGTHWKITNPKEEMMSFIESTDPFPNALRTDDSTAWTASDGTSSQYLSVHCEVAGKDELYSRLRGHFEQCSSKKSDAESALNVDFKNEHFDVVVQREAEEWIFGMDTEFRYFWWNQTGNEEDTDSVHIRIPSVGIGTAGIANDREVIECAMENGYELIDSASDHAPWYQNEYIIGDLLRRDALKQKREDIWITTKLYAKDQGMTSVRGLEDSLNALNTEWIDIYLIHHPHCDLDQCDGTWKTSWRIMEDYYFRNKIKFVGVSNFDISELHELLDWSRIPVSVIQNWFDPFRQSDRNIIAESRRLGIAYQAYSLLGTQWKYRKGGYRGNSNPVFTSETLRNVADKYQGKSVAQVVLRWALQNEIGVLPSSSEQDRIKENVQLFDFELTEGDMLAVDHIV